MKTMKKILSMFLCLALVIGFIPTFTMPTRALGESITEVTSVDQLTIGAQVIFTDSDGANAMGAQTSTKYRDRVTFNNSTVVIDNVAIFTVEAGKTSGSYAFKDAAGNYLYYSGSSNELYSKTMTLDNTASWTVAFNSSDMVVTNVGNTERVLQYNSSSPRFACYKSTQENVKLWLVGTGSEGGETPNPDTPDPDTPDTPVTGSQFVKVTSKPADWSGTYLIVYEAGNVAFNGGLTTLDATSNTVAVTISKNTIAFSEDLLKASFTIATYSTGYSIKSNSGQYIGQDSAKNGLTSASSEMVNTIEFSDGSPVIKGKGGYVLQYNKTSGQTRFRYYNATQQDIALYKLQENTGCDGTNHIYENGTCSCGDVVIKMVSGTLLYENNIQIRIKFSLAETTADDKGMMIFSNPTDAAAHTNPVLMCDFSYDGDNNCYYSYSQGIVAKNMGISAYYVGYAKYGDTYVYTDVLEYSPKIYAQNMLNSDTSSEKTKNLCAALLHYGAAAQKYFDNSLTAEQLMNYNVANLPAFTYDETVLGNSNFNVETGEKNGFTVASANILFDDAITYRIKYIPSAELQGKDLNMEFFIGDIYSAVPINEAGYAYIERKAPKDMDDVITCTPYYLEADGVTKVCGPTLTYSGYEYVRRTIENSNDANMVALAKAFAMYIDCANKAFEN